MLTPHYLEYIPPHIAQALINAGCDWVTYDFFATKSSLNTYSEVIDWLMSNGVYIIVEPHWDMACETITDQFDWCVEKRGSIHATMPQGTADDWFKAADEAILMGLKYLNSPVEIKSWASVPQEIWDFLKAHVDHSLFVGARDYETILVREGQKKDVVYTDDNTVKETVLHCLRGSVKQLHLATAAFVKEKDGYKCIRNRFGGTSNEG